jgi:hypothetical protein
MRTHTKDVVEKRKENTLLQSSKFLWEYNIKLHLNNIGVRVWAGLKWLGIGYNDNFFNRRQLNFHFLKTPDIPLPVNCCYLLKNGSVP